MFDGVPTRRDHADLAEGRDTVEHPDLHRAEIRVRADVPPHLFDAPDGPGAKKRVPVLLELTPARELWRGPGRRQPAEDDRPARGEPRVLPAPKRARRGQR